jgi:hypothetical protein
LDALLRYFPFNTWEDVLSFMFVGLELDTGWSWINIVGGKRNLSRINENIIDCTHNAVICV